MVAIIVTNPSILRIENNIQFFSTLLKLLEECSIQHPNYDFAIINGLELQEFVHDFQLERSFNLVLLKNRYSGFKYENEIFAEGHAIDLVKILNSFIEDYERGRLKEYLKSEETTNNAGEN